MLPIGGHYTMGMEHAAIATKWTGAQAVIPMHFDTFAAIEVDTVAFESMIIEQEKTPLVMEIGESIELA
jgi:L-ascorbate metabolism protein UlaG (beta-lactamase superfamily)